MPFLRNAMVKSQIVALGGSLLKTREGHDLDGWFSDLVDLCKKIQDSNAENEVVSYAITSIDPNMTQSHSLSTNLFCGLRLV